MGDCIMCIEEIKKKEKKTEKKIHNKTNSSKTTTTKQIEPNWFHLSYSLTAKPVLSGHFKIDNKGLWNM